MRVLRVVLMVVLWALLAPAVARADVERVRSNTYIGPAGSSGGVIAPPIGQEAGQVWLAAVTVAEGAEMTSMAYGGRAFTRVQLASAFGARSELWALADPQPDAAKGLSVAYTTGSRPHVGLVQLAGADLTNPFLGSTAGQANGGAAAASLTLTGGTPSDMLLAALSHSSAADSAGLTATPPPVVSWSWHEPIRSGGNVGRGAEQGTPTTLGWTWTSTNPLNNRWTATMVGVRSAASTPTVSTVTVATPQVERASFSSRVTGDGRGGNVTARGYVYCQGCPTPALGAPGSTAAAAGTGLGAVSAQVTGLARNTSYTVRAYATNAQGTRYSTAVTFTSRANAAPTASAGGPYSMTEGAGLALSASATDADGDALIYTWDLDADGQFDDATGAAPQLSATRAAELGLDNGPLTRQIRVQVQDGFAATIPFAVALTVTNAAPTGVIANQTVAEGATATIGLTGVTDPAPGDIAAGLRYAYDFQADGTYEIGSTTYAQASTATTASLPAALTADGPLTRNVRVAVVDRDGGFSAYSASVTVTNVAPSATLANNGPIAEGATAQVSWAGVTDPSGPDAAAGTRYGYDFGNDGSYEIGGGTYATASPLAAIDVPAALTADDGTVAVRAVVIDKDDGLRTYATTLTINNVAPTGTLANSGPVAEGATAQVAYAGVTDGPADLAAGIRYAYDFGNDGTYEIGSGTYATASALATVDVPAALTADGDDDVEVRAILIDKDGGQRASTTTVEVDNVAPTLTVAGPDAVPSSGAVTLDVGVSDPGGDAVTGTIDWGDGTTEPLAPGARSHTYTAPGPYTITVRGRDEDGADAAPITHLLTVAAAPAAPAPTPAPAPVTPAAPKPTISGLQVTPRCIRAPNLRALTAQRRTVRVRFSLNVAADVRFSLERWTGKPGARRCPSPTGKAKADGRKVPGVYSPHTGRTVRARAGVNTVTLAATGRAGKALRPGTYLLTVRAGDATARTKVWVLAN